MLLAVATLLLGGYSGAGVLWSAVLHQGECRSVDLCPAGKLLLSGGFDGSCHVTAAGDGGSAGSYTMHADKVGPS